MPVARLGSGFKKLALVQLLTLTLCWVACAGATKYESDSMAQIAADTKHLAKAVGTTNVLVVFDLDDTLLSITKDIGSEPWFNWQEKMVLENVASDDRIAQSFPELLQINAKLLHMVSSYPTESTAPKILSDLQASGFSTIIVTSRGPDARDATLRELKRNGFDFGKGAIGPKPGFAGDYYPYDWNNPEAYGLTQREVAEFKLGAPREVHYENGVLLTSGQHKGAMIKALLKKTGASPDAIVFVDNSQKHVDRVHAAYKDAKIEVLSIRYSARDGEVAKFNAKDKAPVVQEWREFKSVFDRAFPAQPVAQ